MSRRLTISVALVAMGCGSVPPISTLRFYNRDPVWTVSDRTPIPAPRVREPETLTDDIDALLRRKALHRLAVPDPVPAKNVNALGDVPDSSWFTNRIGVRELSRGRWRADPISTSRTCRPRCNWRRSRSRPRSPGCS